MGFFDLDEARIMRIFNANGVRMSLKKAFEVASLIYGAHLERVNEVENNTWNVARKEADERVNVAYQNGYEQGKRDAEVPSNYEMDKLRRLYDFQKEKAQEVVKEAVQKHGTKRKIQVIKDVRNATGLGLKDSKDIVDKYVADLNSGLADWERELLETPHGAYYDEPPF